VVAASKHEAQQHVALATGGRGQVPGAGVSTSKLKQRERDEDEVELHVSPIANSCLEPNAFCVHCLVHPLQLAIVSVTSSCFSCH
jgi:hypothetical protein